MRRLLAAVTMVFALSVLALAGDIPISGSPEPSATNGSATTTTSPGDIPTDGFAEQVSDAAMSGLVNMLGFLVS